MKITVCLSNAPLSVTIEGGDEVMDKMISLAYETLIKMREVWLNALECQLKLQVKKEVEAK